jgi:hypothetical protein
MYIFLQNSKNMRDFSDSIVSEKKNKDLEEERTEEVFQRQREETRKIFRQQVLDPKKRKYLLIFVDSIHKFSGINIQKSPLSMKSI